MTEETNTATDTDDVDGDPNPILVYECSDKFVAMHEEAESDLLWQAVGDSQDEVVEDMIETLNYLPSQMQEVRNGEAELVDVIPLKQGASDD